jgi:putative ABC transport system permease protein
VRSVPGVVSAGEVSGGLPLTGSWSRTDVELPGRGELKGENDEIDVRNVTPGYLELLRIPLRRGRTIAATDRENTPPVLVINETAARKYWPGRDPIGQHVKLEQKDFEVVGVVARTTGRPLAVLPAMKSAIWRINPEQRLTSDTVTLDSYMDRLIAQRRFNMAVLALFGMLGLMIAAVGIYGVMSYIVAQRTSEIGVRMALGATRGRVMGMVLGRAVLLMVSGIAIGGAAAWYFSAGVRTFLFDVQPTDKTIFAMALGTLLAAGLIASAIPALRAAAVDPLVALRHE